jgi:phosphatidylglycerol:prolipoprotein diacylglycerol transferase
VDCLKFYKKGGILVHPILFQFGFLKVYSYGFFLALAILAGTLWLMRKVEKKGVSAQFVIDFALLGTVAGIVGARLAYILIYAPGYYLSHPLQIFMLQQGGMAFYGTILFSFSAAAIYLRQTRVPVLAFLDLAAPCLMLGYAIGRIGCFFNGCCYGIPTTLPIGMVFPAVDNLPRYPTQLFSMAAGLLIFAILELVSSRIRFRGQVVALLFILYGLTRSVIELFRENSSFWGGGAASLAALGIAVAGAIFYFYLARKNIDPVSSDLRPDNSDD